ncbi:tyrosine-type recombinase/integrase [Rugamonas sp. FT81W]|nr:tyrosine-type recombinase/integrase [Duganella vulcania]
MPLLIDSTTGVGLYEPTAFSLALRSTGAKRNTLTIALRAVQFLYESISDAGFDLMERAKNNDLLTLGEVEALVAQCKYFKSDLPESDNTKTYSNVSAIGGKLRRKVLYGTKPVKNGTTASRLIYITAYITWFSDYVFMLKTPENRMEFKTVSEKVIKALKARTPKKSSKKVKKGITKKQESLLLEVVGPAAPGNPWNGEFVRKRNNLIIRILLSFGIRKGELLGLKIKDISFKDNTVFVARRPDDPEDPRKRQPEAKTAERILPMGPSLVELLKQYLVDRNNLDAARRHPFVIVSDDGAPLALNSVDYLFSTLRNAFPALAPISAHILRHTWNDRFSEVASKMMNPAEEKKARNYFMGWSEESEMAENYTVRFVQELGYEAMSKMQDVMYAMGNK